MFIIIFFRKELYSESTFAPNNLQNVLVMPNASYCLLGKNRDFEIGNNFDSFLCFKHEFRHFPDLCNIPYASPVTSKVLRKDGPTVIKGLTVQSLDCAYTLAINISKHYEWINSVVFRTLDTKNRLDEGMPLFNFRDPDLILGQGCFQPNGVQGVCKSPKECTTKTDGPMLLCEGDAICC